MTIDYEKLEAHGQIAVRPHVIVLPSDLQHFYKDLGEGATLAVNPGRLTKKEGGGVYARIRIRPRPEDAEEGKEEQAFVKRVAADIVRI